jgi:putative spermidine/putrescine transport system substrate-binding protein
MTTIRLLATTALVGVLGTAATAQDGEVVVMGWGGAYTISQTEGYHKPFAEETGIRVVSVDADNPATPIKAQVEAGNVTVDVASLEFADAVRLCDEGLLEVIDPSILPAAPDGTPAAEDFMEGGITDCMIATDVWATVVAYDTTKFPDNPPTTIADFFDLEGFPGKRAMRRGAKANLEMALMADGVPPEEVYATLETDEGLDRAFAKLDTIKSDVVWWEAGAQPPQLLADGEVAMTTGYNGRIFFATVNDGSPFDIVWDGQVYELEGWSIPKGAPNLENALQFVAHSTSTAQSAKASEWISYGPPRASAAAIAKTFQGKGEVDMEPHLPTTPANLEKALLSSNDFWVDRDTELNERFNAWIAAN